MSRWCDHYAITPAQRDRLLKAAGEGKPGLGEWVDSVEGLRDTPRHVEMNHIWEEIHRALTGDDTPRGWLDPECGPWPLCLSVLGGRPLHDEDEPWSYTYWLVEPEQVAEAASALACVDERWLRKRYFALSSCYPEEEGFAWDWEELRSLVALFARAAAEGRAVLCTISH
jgi:hypothetical protein